MMPRFTFRQIEYFIAVGEAGSIALAATRLNVSSPSISTAIAQLEHEFDLQLFVRRKAQGLALTPGGRQFFDEARHLLDNADRLHALASDIAGEVGGPLRVGCLRGFAQFVLPELRRSFERDWPKVEIRHYAADHKMLMRKLYDAGIDIVLTYDFAVAGDVAFEPLVSLPPYVLLAEAHPLAGADCLSLTELAGEPLVLLDLPLSRNYFLSLFQAQKLTPLIGERTSDIAVMRSLIANGFGYGLTNIRFLVDVAPDGKRLRQIPLEPGLLPMVMGLATLDVRRKTRTLKEFEAHCRRQITPRRIPGMKTPEQPGGG